MDIIFILVMLLGIYIGFRRGFIKVLFSAIGIFLAILLALITYKTVVKNIVPKTGLDQKVHSYIETKVDSKETFINIPEPLQEYIDADIIVNQAQSSVVDKLTNFVINIATIIVLIILFYVIITIIRILLDNVAKLPIFNIFNKIGGGLLGGIKTYVIVLICFTAISFLGIIGKGEGIVKFIDNSIISKNIYNNNPISKIVIAKEIDKTQENKEEGKLD